MLRSAPSVMRGQTARGESLLLNHCNDQRFKNFLRRTALSRFYFDGPPCRSVAGVFRVKRVSSWLTGEGFPIVGIEVRLDDSAGAFEPDVGRRQG